MNSTPQSPFQKPQKRLSYGMDWILLVMLVAATSAALLGYAMFLPSVTSEFSAWIGRTVDVGEVSNNRRWHIIFLVACYSAPLVLSIVARVIYILGRKLTQPVVLDKNEEQFRME